MSNANNSCIPRLRFPGFEGKWEEKKLVDVCNPLTPPLKLQSSDYLSTGKFPVIDQSQSLICGWTNDASGLITNVPVIIFGDHTCVLKYIDFPFVQGADGVKILSSKEGFNPQFVYQAFASNPVKQDGYKRHFSDFKEKTYFFPNTPDEQQKIASCLSELDNLIAAQGQKVDALKEKKKGLMQQLFPQPGETTPRLRFPGFEGEWVEKKVSACLEERNEQFPESEDYPLMAFVAEKGVTPKGEKYDRSALVKDAANKKYKRTEFGDFIYSSNNLESGSIGFNTYGSACISPVYSIFKSKNNVDSTFIGTLLTQKRFISEMVKYRQGVVYGQWKIPEKEFLEIKIFLPSISEQQKIASCLSSLDDLIAAESAKVAALKDLKKGLMQQLFPQPTK